MSKKAATLVSAARIEPSILIVRGQRVMLDAALAELYGVSVGRLNEAVKRKKRRFPEHFMFQLTSTEWRNLKSQSAIASPGWGGRRTPPYAFTEQGVAMLSSVLNSEQAIQVNIAIMDTFVRLRQLVLSNPELARRMAAIEKKSASHDAYFKAVFKVLRQLMESRLSTKRTRKKGGPDDDDGSVH